MLQKQVAISISHWKKKMNVEKNITSKVFFRLIFNFAKYKYKDYPYPY